MMFDGAVVAPAGSNGAPGRVVTVHPRGKAWRTRVLHVRI
ncbi:MAG: hypothetical protein JWM71_1299 [Solirubrobacteraceae bacterium]|nr:hypothetical protein [Solirubrobacteraceae bacterium]